MLHHPTLDKLRTLKLSGMCKALNEQAPMPDIDRLSFEERLGLLVDRELTERASRAMETRLRKARLRQPACVEDIDYRHPRGLDKGQLSRLLDGDYLKQHRNILITGPTGVGKTYLACALAQHACRLGYSVMYVRLPRLLPDLSVAKGDGRYNKLLKELARADLLLLDDWGLAPLTDEHRRDLLEIMEERHGRKSTLMTSQLPLEHWHEAIGDPTLADAILDRLVHNAYTFKLNGESLRKKKAKLTPTERSE